MIVTPPARALSPKPVALLVPGWRSVRAFTVEGERSARGPSRVRDLLVELEDHSLYVESSLRGLLPTTGAREWVADVWRGRAVGLSLVGSKVRVSSLKRTLEDSPTPEGQFAALLEVVGLLSDQGVRAASVSSMAWSLWRSTLTSPLELSSPPRVARSSFFGPRQESTRPQVVHDYVSLDMASAYPWAMTSRPYGGVLREVSRHSTLDPETSGLAEATVTVPDELRFPPLPIRVAPELISWRWGQLEGVWPWAELVAAIELGCAVEVSRSWAPVTEVDPFGPWWDLVRSWRGRVSGPALRLVKALSTVLWGVFAMSGDDSARVIWADDAGERPVRVPKPPKRMPHARAVHLASETSSRVRVRMLTEGLYGDRSAPIHVDTDGVIVPAESVSRRRLGVGVGEWRVKQTMSVVDLRAPQLYRFECGVERCGWHYVASGVPKSLAPDVFRRRHPGYQISLDGIDKVIPGGLQIDADQVKLWQHAANTLERSVFGARIA